MSDKNKINPKAGVYQSGRPTKFQLDALEAKWERRKKTYCAKLATAKSVEDRINQGAKIKALVECLDGLRTCRKNAAVDYTLRLTKEMGL